MRPMRAFCFTFLWTAFTFATAHSSSSDPIVVFEEERPSLIAFYLKNLEEFGYCVIPQVLTAAETEVLYQRVWHEYIEKAWPNCKMDDRSNWKEAFPMPNLYGIFAESAAQIQVMWDLRQDPRIVDVFAKIWGTRDLIVSMDGMAILCPPEIRTGHAEPWFHVDQTRIKGHESIPHTNTIHPSIDFGSDSLLKTNASIIQGQFLFEDSFSGDGGFYCIPKSHLRFNEFAPQLEALSRLEVAAEEELQSRNRYLLNFFGLDTGRSDTSYRIKHITAPRGSLILWDARTVHWNQYASKERSKKENSKVGMAGYLCYVPKEKLTHKARTLKGEAFKAGASTRLTPTYFDFNPTKDHIKPEFKCHFEDASYTQPQVRLSSLRAILFL